MLKLRMKSKYSSGKNENVAFKTENFFSWQMVCEHEQAAPSEGRSNVINARERKGGSLVHKNMRGEAVSAAAEGGGVGVTL